MSEAGQSVLRFAFETMHAHRIRCAAAQENIPSQKVIERLGFKQEGVAREAEFVAGRWVTHFVYSLLENEFAPSEKDE